LYVMTIGFLFQAEDGIRVFHVTGVQTCALPIWCPEKAGARPYFRTHKAIQNPLNGFVCPEIGPGTLEKEEDFYASCSGIGDVLRSEERRVVKECRYGLCAY